MKKAYVVLLLLLLLGCTTQETSYVITIPTETSNSQEYENMYIALQPGEDAIYNISGFPGESYEVHFE